MLERVRPLDEIEVDIYRKMWGNLAGATEEELDWRPHAEANSVRWVLGHLVWSEEWFHDILHQTGRYLSDELAQSYPLATLDEIRARFDAARDRYRASLIALSEDDLDRQIDYLGAPAKLRDVVTTHTTHLAGGRYQIRYIRGTYSRAHGTNKKAFDRY